MKKVFLILSTFILIGCNQSSPNKNTQEIIVESTNIDKLKGDSIKPKNDIDTVKNSSFTRQLDYKEINLTDSTLFTYFNLDSFDLRASNYGSFAESLNSFRTKDELYNYFQNKRVYEDYIYPINIWYFSIQKTNSDETILTILEGDEHCCNELHYLVYDSNNKLLSDNILAGTGGDGMWAYDKYGIFINDSTYKMTMVEFSEEDLSDSEEIITEIDSTITFYRYNKSDSLKVMSSEHFKKTL